MPNIEKKTVLEMVTKSKRNHTCETCSFKKTCTLKSCNEVLFSPINAGNVNS